ncbi:MAG: hypothetical protein ACE5J7_03255 [Candidatus Aenigmatarchaeota archaeon]
MRTIFHKGMTSAGRLRKTRKGMKIVVQGTRGGMDFIDDGVLDSIYQADGTEYMDYTAIVGGEKYKRRIDLKNYKGELAIYSPSPPVGVLRR